MQNRLKKTLFHISQLLLIMAIFATGMPVKAADTVGTDLDPQVQNPR